jgi:IS30 family transposase
MTKPGTRSPEVMWREFRHAQPFRIFLHNVPDHFLCNLRSPNNTYAANASENLTVYDVRDSQPVVDRLLHPIGHGNRADVWRRWKAGESLHTIGRAFDRPHTSIHCLLAHHGGIVPAVRRRSVLALTVVEREDISRGLASGSLLRDIAKGLERAPSMVSREVARHGGRPGYPVNDAEQRAWDSALRPKRCLLAIQVKMQEVVASKLILDWSPEQISGWLKIEYPDDESMRVSHETIYRSLFIQARGVKKELLGHLRSKRRIRRSRHSRIFKDSRGQIVDAISIRERPAEIEDRAVPGHWEGDLIGGTKNSHIATLVERHSRFTALVKVQSKDTATVVAALSRQIRRLPTSLRRSLTWDRGLEIRQISNTPTTVSESQSSAREQPQMLEALERIPQSCPPPVPEVQLTERASLS